MNINIDSLVTFGIMWGIPGFMVTRAYLKMDAEDKKSAMEDFKSFRFLFTMGALGVGTFVIHLGDLLSLTLLTTIGICLFSVGGFFSIVITWKHSKIRSLLILAMVCFMIFLNTG